MKSFCSFIPRCILIVSSGLFLHSVGSETWKDMDSKALSSAVIQFAAKFCYELDKSKSVVSSPLSTEILLALLTLGTTEPSHSQLLKALGIPNDDAIRQSFSSMATKLKSVKGVTLNSANKIYIKEGNYNLVPQLKNDAVKVFDADFEKVDFSKAAAAANLINSWVESKTNNKIKDLLSQDSFSDDTRLVLVNALYFKGNWKNKFDPRGTMDRPFHVNSATTVNVPMMYREDKYFYGESEALDAQLLKLPYVGDEASMLIVLPKQIEGLNDVLKKLAEGHDLISELEQMYSTKVQVTIPKFKIETEIDLKELLPKLGITSIFERKSGLTKVLDNNEPLTVSKAVQKAFIEVNEEGAEAAAATGMVMMMRCMPRPADVFVADRPFVYVLTGLEHTALFIGAFNTL